MSNGGRPSPSLAGRSTGAGARAHRFRVWLGPRTQCSGAGSRASEHPAHRTRPPVVAGESMASVGHKRATLDDLYQVPGKAELINGRIIHLMPTGRRPNRIGGNI